VYSPCAGRYKTFSASGRLSRREKGGPPARSSVSTIEAALYQKRTEQLTKPLSTMTSLEVRSATIRTMVPGCVAVIVLALGVPWWGADETLARARLLYNQGQFEAASYAAEPGEA